MTTQQTSTLADFLLARIAEDEAATRRIQSVGSCEPAYRPARVLAECAAKRAIVEAFSEWDGSVYDGWTNAASIVLPALAAPYADHEDFRAEWR